MKKIYELFPKFMFNRWDYTIELFVIVAIVVCILTA